MSEVRLIDVNKSIRQLEMCKTNANPLDYNTKATYAECIAMLKAAEVVEAEPIRHGRWAHGCYPTVWYGSGEPPEWICSLCHDYTYDTYDYCPNCGAKMDGGKNDD